jgi:phospholipid/cholesterol/gamma-HCH transport system substrate-binding protein
MIEELPPTLDQARTTATRLGSFSGRATPVIRDIRRAAPDLSAAVRYLRPAAGYARLLFAQVPPLEPRLKPMLHRLRTFSVNGQQLAISTGDILRQLDPFVAYLRPFKPELGAMFANVGAATDFPDALGNTARTHLVFSDSTYSGASPDMRKLIDALVAVGGATVAPREGTNPYPAPGSGEKPEPFKGPYPRVQPER